MTNRERCAFYKIPRYKALSKEQQQAAITRYDLANFFNVPIYKRFIKNLPKTLGALYFMNAETISLLIEPYLAFFKRSVLNRGLKTTLKLFKEFSNMAGRLAAGHTVTPCETRIRKDNGLPLRLKPFLSYLYGIPNQQRCSIFIISLPRAIIKKVKAFDYSSIEKASHCTQIPFEEKPALGGYFKRVANAISDPIKKHRALLAGKHFESIVRKIFPDATRNKRIASLRKSSRLHVSTKSGPNGPSISSSLFDFRALQRDPSLFDSVKEISLFTKNKSLNDIIKHLEESPYLENSLSWENQALKFTTSKISVSSEPWYKPRAFAIGDWLSQSALSGLHDVILNLLKKMTEDCSHHQGYAVEMICY
jgi:hypothetical protein